MPSFEQALKKATNDYMDIQNPLPNQLRDCFSPHFNVGASGTNYGPKGGHRLFDFVNLIAYERDEISSARKISLRFPYLDNEVSIQFTPALQLFYLTGRFSSPQLRILEETEHGVAHWKRDPYFITHKPLENKSYS